MSNRWAPDIPGTPPRLLTEPRRGDTVETWLGTYPDGHPDGPTIRVAIVRVVAFDSGGGLYHYQPEDPAGRVKHETKTIGALPLDRIRRFVRRCYPAVQWNEGVRGD